MTDTEPMSSEPRTGASLTTEPTSVGTDSTETISTDTNAVVTAATPSPSAERGTTEQVPSDEHAEAVQLRVELDDVESALDRLDAGTYGTCEICGTELPDEELERNPQTRLCTAHSA
jgi:RNA polymerase-binding transcription factor DksA